MYVTLLAWGGDLLRDLFAREMPQVLHTRSRLIVEVIRIFLHWFFGNCSSSLVSSWCAQVLVVGLQSSGTVSLELRDRISEVMKKLLFPCPVIPEVRSPLFFEYIIFLLKVALTLMSEIMAFLLSHPIYLVPHSMKRLKGVESSLKLFFLILEW